MKLYQNQLQQSKDSSKQIRIRSVSLISLHNQIPLVHKQEFRLDATDVKLKVDEYKFWKDKNLKEYNQRAIKLIKQKGLTIKEGQLVKEKEEVNYSFQDDIDEIKQYNSRFKKTVVNLKVNKLMEVSYKFVTNPAHFTQNYKPFKMRTKSQQIILPPSKFSTSRQIFKNELLQSKQNDVNLSKQNEVNKTQNELNKSEQNEYNKQANLKQLNQNEIQLNQIKTPLTQRQIKLKVSKNQYIIEYNPGKKVNK